MEIIPAIDIINGKCVRLKKGDFSEKTVYHDDPVEVARLFSEKGFKRLHLVDLDGAKEGRVVNSRILKRISERTDLVIDFGGGIKSDADVEISFKSGASMITAGSIAVREPEKVVKWIDKYGPDKIILGADMNKGEIVIDAWKTKSGLDLVTFIAGFLDKGIVKLICTDVNRDGMMNGPAIELYSDLKMRFSDLFLIASGGITSLRDIEELDRIGIDGAIIGKGLYEKSIEFGDLKKYLK